MTKLDGKSTDNPKLMQKEYLIYWKMFTFANDEFAFEFKKNSYIWNKVCQLIIAILSNK